MRLDEIHETYKDAVHFFLIYIHEAHPSDGWQTQQNLYDAVIYAEPTSDTERAEVANACQIALDLKIPMLIDNMNNEVEEKYISEPIRLYVIDPDGAITFNGAQGPRGFDPEAWEMAIRAQLDSAG